MVDISGLNKAEVLNALYHGSHVQGVSCYTNPVPVGVVVTPNWCKTLLEDEGITYFDYLYGRVMKVDLSKDSFNEWLYDRDNGTGKAQEVINALREKILSHETERRQPPWETTEHYNITA